MDDPVPEGRVDRAVAVGVVAAVRAGVVHGGVRYREGTAPEFDQCGIDVQLKIRRSGQQ